MLQIKVLEIYVLKLQTSRISDLIVFATAAQRDQRYFVFKESLEMTETKKTRFIL